jgi:hypothetical protein
MLRKIICVCYENWLKIRGQSFRLFDFELLDIHENNFEVTVEVYVRLDSSFHMLLAQLPFIAQHNVLHHLQYNVWPSMDNLYDNEDVSRALENIQKHIKTSDKNSLYDWSSINHDLMKN